MCVSVSVCAAPKSCANGGKVPTREVAQEEALGSIMPHTAPTMKERDHGFFCFVLSCGIKMEKAKQILSWCWCEQRERRVRRRLSQTKPSMDGSGPCLFLSSVGEQK